MTKLLILWSTRKLSHNNRCWQHCQITSSLTWSAVQPAGSSISRSDWSSGTDLQSIQVQAFNSKVAHFSVVDKDWFIAWGLQAYCKHFLRGRGWLVAWGNQPGTNVFLKAYEAIMQSTAHWRNKVSQIKSGQSRYQNGRSSTRAAHNFILFRAAQMSAASDKSLTRATETGRDDGRSMECGSQALGGGR